MLASILSLSLFFETIFCFVTQAVLELVILLLQSSKKLVYRCEPLPGFIYLLQ